MLQQNNAMPIHSRLEHVLNAKNRLPPQLNTLFGLLFEQGMSEAQACEHLHVDIDSVKRDRTSLIRSLKAATA